MVDVTQFSEIIKRRGHGNRKVGSHADLTYPVSSLNKVESTEKLQMINEKMTRDLRVSESTGSYIDNCNVRRVSSLHV